MIALFGLLLCVASDFERGSEAYGAERYDEAFALFESALADPEVPQGPVLHNLGNCAYRLERYRQAIVFYAQASLRMPFDVQVRTSLNLAREQLGLEPLSSAPGGFDRFDMLPPATRLWMVGGLQFLALSGVVLLRRRSARFLMLGVLGISLIGVGHLVQVHLHPPPIGAVISADEVSLRGDPHTNLAILLELKAGEIVQVEEFSARWARITHPRGSGWIERSGLTWID